MSLNAQDLARNLVALASAPNFEGTGVYFLEERDGDLVQTEYVEEGPIGTEYVCSGVKPNTPARYYVSGSQGEQRTIVYVDDSGTLVAIAYDLGEGEWFSNPMDGVSSGVSIHPSSQLSGFANSFMTVVAYQELSGQLGMIIQQDGEWYLASPIPARFHPGAPHATCEANGKMHVFYYASDHGIVHLARDYMTKQWETTIVSNSTFDVLPTRLMAIPIDGQDQFDIYVLHQSRLVCLAPGGDRVEHGVVKDGVLIPSTAAQCRPRVRYRYGGSPCYGGNVTINITIIASTIGSNINWSDEVRKALPRGRLV
ncbi:hypothetical protein BJX65DRAFT_279994 [Aspergillus insuetus]